MQWEQGLAGSTHYRARGPALHVYCAPLRYNHALRGQIIAPQRQGAVSCIFLAMSSLFIAEIFFESSNPFISIASSNITAAANTGPAKGPLPASSTPASINSISVKYVNIGNSEST